MEILNIELKKVIPTKDNKMMRILILATIMIAGVAFGQTNMPPDFMVYGSGQSITNPGPENVADMRDDIGSRVEILSESTILVTNVVEGDNAIKGPDTSIIFPSYPVQYGTEIIQPATEKYQDIKVAEVTTLQFRWKDKDWTVTHRKLVSYKRRVFRKKEEWEEVGGSPE